MHAAILKTAALAGVMGVGCGGVWYVQKDLATTVQAEPTKFTELDPQMQGEPTPGLTGADPFSIPTASPSKGADPSALASVPAAEMQSQGNTDARESSNPFAEIGEQSEPAAVKATVAQTEDPADKFVALAAPGAEDAAAPVRNSWARDRKMTIPPADTATDKNNPWKDLPALTTLPSEKEKAVAPRTAANNDEIDLVGVEQQSEPVASPLKALPDNHPGPVLMPVPESGKGNVQTADTVDPFSSIGGEPAEDSKIQQVQGELPEIRPARSRSTIPQKQEAVAPAGANPLSFEPAAAAAPLQAQPNSAAPIRSSIPTAGPTNTAPVDLSPTPAPANAVTDPFNFGGPSAAQQAPPAREAPVFNLNRTAPNEAPANTKMAIVPIEDRPSNAFAPQNNLSGPSPTPAANSSIPGNRGAIPELGSLSADPAATRLDPAPVRRTPIVDLIGDGVPGDPALVGPQQPEVKIEKIAPKEAVIGEPLIYEIKVRNIGQSTAHRVIVEDRIPLGATCQGTIPQAETADKRLYWKLGDLRPGEDRDIKIKLTPMQAGSMGSVATVSFAAEVTSTTVITAPDLKVDLQVPPEIVVGEQATFRIQVRNAGQGQAKSVFLRALLPKGLKHPGGTDIEYEIGSLNPGQSKEVELFVAAEAAGAVTPKVILTTNNQEQDARVAQVNVIDTRLKIVRNGPTKRFVGRPATFANSVTNQSNAALRDVLVVESLPADLEPTGKLSNGQWDPQTRTISWRIAQLAPNEKIDLPIDLIPRKPGSFDGSLKAHDASGNQATLVTHMDVAGYSNLVVDVVPDGPVAVGEQVSMRLSVRNRGTAPAANVQTVFEVPANLKFVNANGPVQHQASGNVIHFATMDVIPPGGEQQFDIVLTAASEGTDRVKVDLYSDDHKTQPLHEEGEVRVYRD
jgi:uncharacterized repeat protein (TIGR01451 family)